MKPILFNTEMVRAIQAGLKTVTRRVVKFPVGLTGSHQVGKAGNPENPLGLMWACGIKRPPYLPGDILYVRETWRVWRERRYEADAHIEFKAGGEGTVLTFPNGNTDSINRDAYDRFVEKWGVSCKWHPSIHMPREAARIFLRVTDVRVQQLKDVTEEDARAEGFYTRAGFITAILKMYPDCTEDSWLWVVEFERISREEAMQNGS